MTKNTNTVELQDAELESANGGYSPDDPIFFAKAPKGFLLGGSGNDLFVDDEGHGRVLRGGAGNDT